MRFVVLTDDFFIDETPLKGKYTVEDSGGEFIYQVEDISVKPELSFLELYGIIRLIHEESSELDNADDIIRLTDSVDILEGGSVYLKVKLMGKEFMFTELQLMSSVTLKRYMLRLGRFFNIKTVEWAAIVQYWLDTGSKTHEISDDEVLIEKAINYLKKCVIYTDIEKALGYHSLFYDDDEQSTVFCLVDSIIGALQIENRRKVRSVLSDYIEGDSMRKYVYGERKRFWQFKIDKCEINLTEQMHEHEEGDDGMITSNDEDI